MNIYGVRGFPTPDFTDERHCRTFSIPNTTIALAAFMGAIWVLAQETNWQQVGDMTPAEAAEQFQDVIWEAYASDEGICPFIEAPYWSTYDNADDQVPEGDAETWYGELVAAAALRSPALLDDELTWRENLGIWAIAGFIAYSGQIGAAIAFVPFARRFVLKFRGNPLGAIAEIFVDGEKLTTLDTASAEDRIKAIDIQLPDDDDEHEIWVAVGEDSPEGSTLQVVRKELNPNEVYPENLRYNSDCDCVQQTYDDGATWVDQPGQDPRHSTTYLFPPITADDPRCQAAANMSAFFENLIGTTLSVLSTGLDVLGLATTIMPLFIELGPFAILFELGLGLSSGLIGLGVDVLNMEFTPEVYDALTCIFFCNIEADGIATAEDLSAINAQIIADLNPDVQLILGLCFLLMGEVGLSNAGATGEAPADCDECECGWCYEQPLDSDDGNLVANFQSGQDLAEWVSGAGWRTVCYPFSGTFNLNFTIMTFSPPVELSLIDVICDVIAGTDIGALPQTISGSLSGSPVFSASAAGMGGTDIHYSWTGRETVDRVEFNFYSSRTDCSGQLTMKHYRFAGFGDNPFPADNC